MQNQIQSSLNQTDFKLDMLTDRIEALESIESTKSKRLRRTDAQRFLLMYHSGLLDPIIQNSSLSQNKKDLLVSTILDIDPDNARKFLSELGKRIKPLLLKESNYKFLVDFYEGINYTEKIKETEKSLIRIRAAKNK